MAPFHCRKSRGKHNFFRASRCTSGAQEGEEVGMPPPSFKGKEQNGRGFGEGGALTRGTTIFELINGV